MPSPTPIVRSLRVIEHLLVGASIALGVALGRACGLQVSWVPDVVRWWHARLCRALGMRVEVAGEPAANALLMANHVSWLDIPVLGSRERMDFLAKTEVRDWPLIGWMAGIAGTLFITRGGYQTSKLIPHIGALVRAGKWVTVFPEGTTTDGSRLQHFHSRLFGAGQLDGVLVQPVALRYGTNSSPDPVAPFIGDDALLPHLVRVVCHPDLCVQVRFLPPLDGSALTRRQIAEHCRRAISETLGFEDTGRSSPVDNLVAAPKLVSTSTLLDEAA